MINLFIIVGVIVLIGVSFELFSGNNSVSKNVYRYKKKERIMSVSEQECFELLLRVISNGYFIFPQIHLSEFLDEHIPTYQNWRAARRHIDEKSVDFVLCSKEDMRPLLAIELDDSSHERPDRKKRDADVENMLKEAGMSLLRLTHHDLSNFEEFSKKVNLHLIK